MSWLDESVKKEKDREKASEIRWAQHKIILQKKQDEFERLTPMVKQLLSDMGERYWGSFISIKKYKVEVRYNEEDSERYGYKWSCRFKDIFHNGNDSRRSWDVKLKFTPKGNASHFVTHRISTPANVFPFSSPTVRTRSWDVELKFTPEGNASHFVTHRISTPSDDTSESELKKLLVSPPGMVETPRL